jgi:hypothetical protein
VIVLVAAVFLGEELKNLHGETRSLRETIARQSLFLTSGRFDAAVDREENRGML